MYDELKRDENYLLSSSLSGGLTVEMVRNLPASYYGKVHRASNQQQFHGVMWDGYILHLDQLTIDRVRWLPLTSLPLAMHYCRALGIHANRRSKFTNQCFLIHRDSARAPSSR